MDVDHVGRDVPAAPLQLFNLLAISCEDLFRRGVARQIRGGLPAFIVDADARKVVAHLVVFAKRTIFIRDSKHSHGIISWFGPRRNHAVRAAPERTSTSIRNS